jgi:hypothetical protein
MQTIDELDISKLFLEPLHNFYDAIISTIFTKHAIISTALEALEYTIPMHVSQT